MPCCGGDKSKKEVKPKKPPSPDTDKNGYAILKPPKWYRTKRKRKPVGRRDDSQRSYGPSEASRFDSSQASRFGPSQVSRYDSSVSRNAPSQSTRHGYDKSSRYDKKPPRSNNKSRHRESPRHGYNRTPSHDRRVWPQYEDRRSFYEKHTCLCWVIIVTVVIVVIGVAIGLLFHFGVIGLKRPEESATTTAAPVKTVVKFKYSVNTSKDGKWYEDGTSHQTLTSEDKTLKCEDAEKLGVCPDGRCAAYVDGPSESDGQWEDNCDKPNPCWQGDTSMITENVVSRGTCEKPLVEQCNFVRHAVVWMQHLRCKVGKNGKSPKNCAGLPMRLWLCKECNNSGGHACSNFDPSNPCAPCQDNKPKTFTVESLTGYKCKHPDDPSGSKEAYCFRGQCFFVHGNVATKSIPKGKCTTQP